MNWILVLISLILFVTAGTSIAYIMRLPVELGLIVGVLVTLLPPLLQLSGFKTTVSRTIEIISLLLLLIITAVISWQALWPLLNGTSVKIEETTPLLLATVALYIFYLLLNQTGLIKRDMPVTEKLANLFSGPPLILTFIMAVTLTTYILIAINYMQLNYPEWEFIAVKFLKRGIIPPLTLILFSWGLLMLANKTFILLRERRFLNTPKKNNASTLLQTYYQSLQNTGTESSGIYLDLLWRKSADFYIIPRYLNWAIPILGFIGTVLGISLAADGIQNIINSGDNLGQLSGSLGQAIAPLGIAFDTTLIALSLSVFLMLMQTSLQRWEDNLLLDYETRIRNMPLNIS